MTMPVIHLFGYTLQLTYVLLFALLGLFFALLVRWHFKKTNRFDLTDAFLDQRTNRASFDALLTWSFAILAFWWVVTETIGGNKDVGGKLIEILTIFVVYRGAKQAINAYQDKPPAPNVLAAPGDNIAQQVINQPDGAPPAPAKPAATVAAAAARFTDEDAPAPPKKGKK